MSENHSSDGPGFGRVAQMMGWAAEFNITYWDVVLRWEETTGRLAHQIWLSGFDPKGDEKSNYFSAVNMILGPFRQYIKGLADAVSSKASNDLASDERSWRIAENYVRSIAAINLGLIRYWSNPLGLSQEDIAKTLLNATSATEYYQSVRRLAFAMYEASGQTHGVPSKEYWDAAEKHVLALIGKSVHPVNNVEEVTEKLRDFFNWFVDKGYKERLDSVREKAYYIWWDSSHKSMGRALNDWLVAEEQLNIEKRPGEN